MSFYISEPNLKGVAMWIREIVMDIYRIGVSYTSISSFRETLSIFQEEKIWKWNFTMLPVGTKFCDTSTQETGQQRSGKLLVI